MVKSKSTPLIKVPVGSSGKQERCRVEFYVSVRGSGVPGPFLLRHPGGWEPGPTKDISIWLLPHLLSPPGPPGSPSPERALGSGTPPVEQGPRPVLLSRSARPSDLAEIARDHASWKPKDPAGNHLAWKPSHLVSDKLACKSSLIAAFKPPLKNK